MIKSIETVIIGAGQAGLSTSYYLTQLGQDHIVLEQAAQPGYAWSRDRWDSFVLNTPNWSFRLPGFEYNLDHPDGFMTRTQINARFDEYARRFVAPPLYGCRVNTIEPDGKGYIVHTQTGDWKAKNVVMATGMYQSPKIPPFASELPAGIVQIHSGAYRNPNQIPPGAVLVVGSAQSGCQIAEELHQSGHKVFLVTGTAPRVPRRYRGRDIFFWLDLVKFLDRTPDMLTSSAARFSGNPHLTGKDGGHTINLHQFARDGVVLLGHLRRISDGKAYFDDDLKENLARADQFETEIVAKIDELIEANGWTMPEERLPGLLDGYAVEEFRELDLNGAGITTVVWAVGYRFDFSLLQLPVTDDAGFPITNRGVTRFPGVYFVGMPWLYKMKSGLLLGVGEDARYLTEKISSQSR
jgi:putative flavoprotein involved in K+ transport